MRFPPNFHRGERPRTEWLLFSAHGRPCGLLFILVRGWGVFGLSNFPLERPLCLIFCASRDTASRKPSTGSSAFQTVLPAGTVFLGETTVGHTGDQAGRPVVRGAQLENPGLIQLREGEGVRVSPGTEHPDGPRLGS